MTHRRLRKGYSPAVEGFANYSLSEFDDTRALNDFETSIPIETRVDLVNFILRKFPKLHGLAWELLNSTVSVDWERWQLIAKAILRGRNTAKNNSLYKFDDRFREQAKKRAKASRARIGRTPELRAYEYAWRKQNHARYLEYQRRWREKRRANLRDLGSLTP